MRSLIEPLPHREDEALRQNLAPGEEILAQVVGLEHQALVLTDGKVLTVKSGFMAGATFGAKVASFQLQAITSVEVRTSSLKGVLEISTAAAPITHAVTLGGGPGSAYELPNCVPFLKRKDLDKFQAVANLIRERASSPGPIGHQADIPHQLERLAGLRDQGVITSQDFEAKKKELLARL